MDKNNFNFKTVQTVYVPAEKGVYPINEDDWSHIKREVDRVIPAKRRLKDASSICTGIFISAFFSLLGFITVPNVPNWIYIVAITITIASFLLAIAFAYLNTQQEDQERSTIKVVREEMDIIEKKFVKDNDIKKK